MYSYYMQLREETTAKSQEIDRETRRKAKLEKDMRAIQVMELTAVDFFVPLLCRLTNFFPTFQAEAEAKAAEVRSKQVQVLKAEEDNKKLESILRDTRVRKMKL